MHQFTSKLCWEVARYLFLKNGVCRRTLFVLLSILLHYETNPMKVYSEFCGTMVYSVGFYSQESVHRISQSYSFYLIPMCLHFLLSKMDALLSTSDMMDGDLW